MKEEPKQSKKPKHTRAVPLRNIHEKKNTAGNHLRTKAAENCPQCKVLNKTCRLACIFQRAARISPHSADSCEPTHPNITQTEVCFGPKTHAFCKAGAAPADTRTPIQIHTEAEAEAKAPLCTCLFPRKHSSAGQKAPLGTHQAELSFAICLSVSPLFSLCVKSQYILWFLAVGDRREPGLVQTSRLSGGAWTFLVALSG